MVGVVGCFEDKEASEKREGRVEGRTEGRRGDFAPHAHLPSPRMRPLMECSLGQLLAKMAVQAKGACGAVLEVEVEIGHQQGQEVWLKAPGALPVFRSHASSFLYGQTEALIAGRRIDALITGFIIR